MESRPRFRGSRRRGAPAAGRGDEYFRMTRDSEPEQDRRGRLGIARLVSRRTADGTHAAGGPSARAGVTSESSCYGHGPVHGSGPELPPPAAAAVARARASVAPFRVGTASGTGNGRLPPA